MRAEREARLLKMTNRPYVEIMASSPVMQGVPARAGSVPVEDDGEALGGGGGVEGLQQGAADGGPKRLHHALHARPRLHLHAPLGLPAARIKRLQACARGPSTLFALPGEDWYMSIAFHPPA